MVNDIRTRALAAIATGYDNYAYTRQSGDVADGVLAALEAAGLTVVEAEVAERYPAPSGPAFPDVKGNEWRPDRWSVTHGPVETFFTDEVEAIDYALMHNGSLYEWVPDRVGRSFRAFGNISLVLRKRAAQRRAEAGDATS